MVSSTRSPVKSRLFWICALITIASALTSAGFSLAALSSLGDAHTNALYAVSRSLSLAFGSLLVVFLHSRIGLMAVAFLMVLVQAGDAVIGALINDPMKTYGPAFLAVVTGVVLFLLFRETSQLTSSKL
ncbi:hypothetical protein [Spirosoma utsteinense]|uniref:hypothetical protein n=1 Tax=Spirosoma utsteinense TaxID=2585773 RepID=UPI001647ADFC|nr:hypothetical protein [Spirosoma utsteinense]MBC3789358.1 hypothetical protein [Spirosoma utsteinense]